jgi:hypothetical protein
MGLTALAGTITGILFAYLAVIGPDTPSDPVVSRQEQHAAKVATWKRCAAQQRKGLRCHPVK